MGDVFAKKPVLSGKAALPALDDESKARRVAFKVRVHENGERSVLDVSGAGYGLHSLDVRFDLPRDGNFDERARFEWDGDSHSVELGFVPVAAIAVIDGGDEIRF